MMTLCSIYWDPPSVLFTLPYINHPVTYYGILFVTGFILGFLLLIPGLQRSLKINRDESIHLADKLTLYIMTATVVGARLGHVLFYELPYYMQHPLQIFMVWKGGLASHGGTLAVIFSIWLFSKRYQKKYPKLTFISLLDILAVPTSIAVVCIRLGNFVNQEILGVATTLPWGVVFGHPQDSISGIARHPVQLYEAFAYLATFVVLYGLSSSKKKLRPGIMIGLFLIFVFGSRFLLEFLKTPMSGMFDENVLQTGQILSIPFILLGIYFLFCKKHPKSVTIVP